MLNSCTLGVCFGALKPLWMRSTRRGLLFGPREAGCWTFLLWQSWLCSAVSAGLAWLYPHKLLFEICLSFFSEAAALSLFLLVVAQVFWAEERLKWVPDWFYQLLGWLFLLMMGCPIAGLITSIELFLDVFRGLILLYASLLSLSLILRLLLSVVDRWRGSEVDEV